MFYRGGIDWILHEMCVSHIVRLNNGEYVQTDNSNGFEDRIGGKLGTLGP